MTPRQAETLTFIKGYIDRHGYSPSYWEIAHGVGLKSQSGSYRLVSELTAAGHVTRIVGMQRSIKPVESCPHCGRSI